MKDKSNSPKVQIKSSLMLLLTALIWGFGFVAQRAGLEAMGVHTFTAPRFILAAFVLGIFLFLRDKKNNVKFAILGNGTEKEKKNLLIAGIACGLIQTVANFFQMSGLKYTTIGKAGFITVLYIFIVPIAGLLLFKKRVTLAVWISVLIALAGSYLLFIQEGFSINKGDLLVLVSAFLFAAHIMVIDHFTKITDSIRMVFLQYAICGILSLIAMFVFENPKWDTIVNASLHIAYAGILSSGVASSLQFVSQKNISAPVASIIMSMESVFAALAGWIFLQESLSLKEIAGCLLIFFGIILAQIPFRSLKRTGKS